MSVRRGVREAHGRRALADRGRAPALAHRAPGPRDGFPVPAAASRGPRNLRALLGALEASRRRRRPARDRLTSPRRATTRGAARPRTRSRVVAGTARHLSRARRAPRQRRALHGLRHARGLRRHERCDRARARAKWIRGDRARRADVLWRSSRARRRAHRCTRPRATQHRVARGTRGGRLHRERRRLRRRVEGVRLAPEGRPGVVRSRDPLRVTREGRERVPRRRRPHRLTGSAPRARRVRRPVPPPAWAEDQRSATRDPRGDPGAECAAAHRGRLVLRQRRHVQRHPARALRQAARAEGRPHHEQRRGAARDREPRLSDADRGRSPRGARADQRRAPDGPARPRVSRERRYWRGMRGEELLAGAIFIGIYALIVTEKIHRTLAALLGASLVILLKLVDQREAFAYVDFNVIFLLAGMMIIANVMAKTGIFQWVAVEAVRRAEGQPYRLLLLTSVITAVASAFLDNVTTVVLLTPITFFVAQRLGTSPVPFLISQVLASNIGGTATLIGDPPNIIIGSQMGKDFNDFLVNLAPAAIAALVVYLLLARWLFRDELRAATSGLERDDIARLVEEERKITNVPLMRISLTVMAFTILGFLLSRPLRLEGATIAITGAVVLMIVAREDVHEILNTVEWPTLFFFIGLFIVVGAVVKAGIISDLAAGVLSWSGGRTDVAALAVLWMSGVISAIVDNIPYTVTMVPLVQDLGRIMNVEPLIWALSLGANFGGNATIIGASANVVVASMSEARGYPLSFASYLRYGVPATLATMLVASVDIWLRYFVFS